MINNEVILTADRTQTSNFNHFIFAGFIPCFAKNWLTNLMYKATVPQKKHLAPIGLRVCETTLLRAGIDCKYVHSNDLAKNVDENTKFVCVSCVNPTGRGPSSQMFKLFFRGKTFLEIEFERLMSIIKKLKEKYDFKVIVGGQGAWRLIDRHEEFGIDHVFLGEADKTLPDLIKNSDDYGLVVEGVRPTANEIMPISHASVLGAVEISRGCGRGCKFCSTTLSGGIRNVPMKSIKQSIRANVNEGQTTITLRAEDFLLYKHKGFVPNTDAVLNLFKECYKIEGVKNIYPIHGSHGAVYSNPDLIFKLDKFLKSRGVNYFGFQPGVETGSDRLLSKTMKGKKIPHLNVDWADMVYDSLKITDKVGWFTCSTMMIGLPDETKSDLRASLDLIKRTKDFNNMMVPQFFVPVKFTSLENEQPYVYKNMTPLRLELFKECFRTMVNKVNRVYSASRLNVNSLYSKFSLGVFGLLKKIYFNFERKLDKQFL